MYQYKLSNIKVIDGVEIPLTEEEEEKHNHNFTRIETFYLAAKPHPRGPAYGKHQKKQYYILVLLVSR